MTMQKKIWCNVLFSWMTLGVFVIMVKYMMDIILGHMRIIHKEAMTENCSMIFSSIPPVPLLEIAFFLFMLAVMVFFIGREFYAIYRINHHFFRTETFQWYWTDVEPYTILAPISSIAHRAPHITPGQIESALQEVTSDLRQRIATIKNSFLFLLLFATASMIFFILHEVNFAYILVPAITFLAMCVLVLWKNQCQKLHHVLMNKLSAWCWKNFSWTPAVEKNLSEPFLQTFLTNWMETMEKMQKVIYILEERQKSFHTSLMLFSEKAQSLADLMKNQHAMLHKWVDEQIQSRHSMEKISHRLGARDSELQESLGKLLIVSREILERFSEEKGQKSPFYELGGKNH